MPYRFFIFGLLMVNWICFSGMFDPLHLTFGVICCAFVTWISSDLLFEDRSSTIGNRFTQAWNLLKYSGWLTWQIVLANLQVLKLAMAPGGMSEVQPSIIKVQTPLQSDFAKFILANSITLTPGTVTMRIEGQDVYVHAINDEAAEGINGEMDRRIAAALGETIEEVATA